MVRWAWWIVTAAVGCNGKDAAPPAPAPASPMPVEPRPMLEAHPDYPTPERAGTDTIFLMEDPDRGPEVALDFVLPRKATASTLHAHCEPDAVSVTCSPTLAGGLAGWRVQKGSQVVIAHELRRGAVARTLAYFTNPDRSPRRRVELDAGGRVVAELRFVEGERRYSGRRRSGVNELEGCGSMGYTLDGSGRVRELRCLQWLGEPMHDTNGVAITQWARNAQGFIVETRRLGVDRRSAAGRDEVALIRTSRDTWGRTVRKTYFGTNGRPAASSQGCYANAYTYAADGATELTEDRCLGAAGESITSVRGAAITRYTYDPTGCPSAERHFSTDGRPAVDHRKVHGVDRTFDAACRVLSSTCLGQARQAVACGPGDAARRGSTRDEAGRVVSTMHFAADGTTGADVNYGVFELRWQWDDRDRAVRMACFDVSGREVECGATGFHATSSTFDDAGREVEQRFLSTFGQPTTNLGTSARRSRYDNYDHLVEASAYGGDGRRLENHGKTTRHNLFDARHDLFAVLLTDLAGKPARYTACFTGATCPEPPWHAVRIVRRSDGVPLQNQFFDDARQLITTIDCSRNPCFE